MSGPQTPRACPQTPQAGPRTPLDGPQTPWTGLKTPQASSQAFRPFESAVRLALGLTLGPLHAGAINLDGRTDGRSFYPFYRTTYYGYKGIVSKTSDAVICLRKSCNMIVLKIRKN